MNLKKNHYSRRALALLLTLVMCVGMIPTAFAAQQNSYHDPAEHWMQASGRTNELDANSVVTRETFKCGECGKATSFEVFRVPEYTRNGQPALSRNVKYSDGTMVDGVGKGDTMDGIPGKDATYTGYHYTKAVCETCGGINTNMSKSEYGYLKNVYWLYDCAAAFTQELDETVSYEYTDDTYHTVTTKGGTYCAFCYGTNHTVSRKLERHSMVAEVLPQPANGRFATVEKCSLCDYARYDYTAAKAVIADYQAISDALNRQSIPYCREVPLWNKHKVKRLLENPRYTGKEGYPILVEADIFQAAQEKTAEKNARKQSHGEKPAIARLTPYFRCTCGGKMTRLGGGWQNSGKLYLRCEGCGNTAVMDMDATVNGIVRQFRDHEQPSCTAYTPSAEVMRLDNAINRGLEQPDSPEAVMALILQGAAARYACCPEPSAESEPSDSLTEADWRRFQRTVSHITISQDAEVTLIFTDKKTTGKDE